MNLTLEKIYLTIKAVSWKFIIPCLVAIVIASTALVASIGQHAMIAATISALTALAFIGLCVGLFIANWIYFRRITDKIDNIYVVGNKRWRKAKQANVSLFIAIIDNLCEYFVELCRVYRIPTITKSEQVERTFKNFVVIFVDDISEDAYNRRWQINYKKIAGLFHGSAIIVEYNDEHLSIIETAFEYECNRAVLIKFKDYMKPEVFWAISKNLGISQW